MTRSTARSSRPSLSSCYRITSNEGYAMTSNEASMVTMSGGSLCTISKGCLPQLLACILLDAATRTSQFEFDMFLACVQNIVGASTRLGLLDDPCQVKSLLKTFTTVASLHSSCTLVISTIQWFLNRFLHAGPKDQEIVHRIDLLNRYQESHRCRVRATAVINRLTTYFPHPPTSTPTLWSEKVLGKKV